VFKRLHENAPDYLKDLIILSQAQCGLRTSNCINHLELLSFATHVKISHAFKFSAPTVWNNLPSSARAITSLSSFKASLKTHYFNQAYMNG